LGYCVSYIHGDIHQGREILLPALRFCDVPFYLLNYVLVSNARIVDLLEALIYRLIKRFNTRIR